MKKHMHFSFLVMLALGLGIAGMVITGCGDNGPETVTVVLATTAGDITLELYPEKAPGTVENFLAYARDGFYEGTIFHRVMPQFVIQGGGFDEFRKPKQTRDPIRNEAPTGLLNEQYTVAMARTNDPDSATSQFYINLKHNAHLDEGYTVFGKVIDGRAVVDGIGERETVNLGGNFANLPVDQVLITEVRVED